MIRIIAIAAVILVWSLAAAQDLVITNARVIDGAGATIDNGSVVVEEGRIVSVVAGSSDMEGIRVDANGMTVMPGLIDTHRHLLPSQILLSDQDLEQWLATRLAGELLNYLRSGVTTIMSTGDYFPAIAGVKSNIESGVLQGPRLLSVGPNFSAPGGHPGASIFARNPWGRALHTIAVADPDTARAEVDELARAGVDAIKVIYDGGEQDVWPRLDEAVLAEIIAEAESHGIPAIVHVHGVPELLTALELGAARFVHTPYRGSIAEAQAGHALQEASVSIATTAGIRAPVEGTDITAGAGRVTFTPLRQAYLSRTLSNVRELWDAGVIVAFGTDTAALRPAAALAHEISTLSRVLSPEEIVTALTHNAATYLDMDEEIGTLTPGKIADIVIVDGDPLSDSTSLANVVLVIQSGRIVVDNR